MRVGVGSSLVEDTTCEDLAKLAPQSHGGLPDIPNIQDNASQPTVRQAGMRRSSRKRKNGNWSDE